MSVRKYAMLFCLIGGIVVFWGVTSAAVTVPTASFLAAALRNQETLCGPSLEVVYEATQDKVNKTKFYSGTYIRTPDVLFSDETCFKNDKAVYTVKTSYDRSAGESRRYAVYSPEDPSKNHVRIQKSMEMPFNMQSFTETSRFAIYQGVLCDVIDKGTVASARESIDGHECWRVTIPSTKPGTKDTIVWLDEDIGFCPRQIIQGFENIAEPDVISFRDYREVKPGVWFPQQHDIGFDTKERPVSLSIRITSATAGKAYSSDQLLVNIPSGTRIYQGGNWYVQP